MVMMAAVTGDQNRDCDQNERCDRSRAPPTVFVTHPALEPSQPFAQPFLRISDLVPAPFSFSSGIGALLPGRVAFLAPATHLASS